MNEAEIKDTPVEDGALFSMGDFKAEEAREAKLNDLGFHVNHGAKH